MLITKTLEVNVTGNVSYYEEKGYTIPKHIDKSGVERVKRGTKITIKTEDLPESSALKVEYECSGCNNIFSTKYYQYIKNSNNLCRSCNMKKVASDKGNIAKRSGENHPRYNEKLTDEEREIGRKHPEYRIWRESVYKECSYIFQCCGDNRGGNLVAHHLNGWHWCKDERFTDYNGVALCKSCHEKFHNDYGYENNTREQFEEFLIKEICSRPNRSEASKIFADL